MFGLDNPKVRHHRYGDMALTVVSNKFEEDGVVKIEYGFSFCSPKDSFVKRVGRQNAALRLMDNDPEYSGVVSIKNADHDFDRTAVMAVLVDIVANRKVPYWGRELVAYSLHYHNSRMKL